RIFSRCESCVVCETEAATTKPQLLRCFFFKAEDGIRDWSVTGVQTCALPICHRLSVTGSMGKNDCNSAQPDGRPEASVRLRVTGLRCMCEYCFSGCGGISWVCPVKN